MASFNSFALGMKKHHCIELQTSGGVIEWDLVGASKRSDYFARELQIALGEA